jgi:hypothetical protein
MAKLGGVLRCTCFLILFATAGAAQAQYQPSPDSGVPGLTGAPGMTGASGLGAPETSRPDPYVPYPTATPYSPSYQQSPYQPSSPYGTGQRPSNPYSVPDDDE